MKAVNSLPHDTTTMPSCPWGGCDYDSDSEYGVKIHHNKVHGVSLRGVKFECDWCGETSRRKKHELEKHDKSFCSNECRFEHAEQTRDGREIECEECGDTAYKGPAQLADAKYGRYFCSGECRGEYYSGENNPHWRGGGQSDFTRTPEGRRWRRQVLEHDDHTCQDCGAEPEVPHTHHIKSKSEHPELKTDVDNGVTLCEDCHADRHPDKAHLIHATSDHGDEGIAWAADKLDQLEDD